MLDTIATVRGLLARMRSSGGIARPTEAELSALRALANDINDPDDPDRTMDALGRPECEQLGLPMGSTYPEAAREVLTRLGLAAG